MSTATQAMLDTAKTAGHDEALKSINQMRTEFVMTFADFINPSDLALLDDALVAAIKAKGKQTFATSPEQAQEAQENYESSLEAMETIGNKYQIVGKAKAGKLIKSLAHTLISGAFAVGGAVLQAGLSVAVPGLGSLLGAGLNAGLQHVVSYFLERNKV